VAYTPRVDRLLAKIPCRFVHGALAAQGAINGKPTTVLLDTAGDFAAALPDPDSDTVRQISLGDLVLRNSPAVSCTQMNLGMPSYPRVGLHLLGRYQITLADQGRVMYVERPAAPDAP
jgi:hypothetical protein